MTHREQVAATSRYPLLATLWFTGLRVSDVITLMATDVNLDQRVIIKQVKKTGKTLRVPLADTLVEILTPILPRSGPVFPKYCPGDSHKRRTGIERNLNHQIQSILKRHNLQHGSLHSFRHGFNQRLFELGLGEVALAFTAASLKADQALIERVLAEHGSEGFVAGWLRARDIGWACDLIPQLAKDGGF